MGGLASTLRPTQKPNNGTLPHSDTVPTIVVVEPNPNPEIGRTPTSRHPLDTLVGQSSGGLTNKPLTALGNFVKYTPSVANVFLYAFPLCAIYFCFNMMGEENLAIGILYGSDSFAYNFLAAILFSKNTYKLLQRLRVEGNGYRSLVIAGFCLGLLCMFAAIKFSLDALRSATEIPALIYLGVTLFSLNMVTSRTDGAANLFLTLYRNAWHFMNEQCNEKAKPYYLFMRMLEQHGRSIEKPSFGAKEPDAFSRYLTHAFQQITQNRISLKTTKADWALYMTKMGLSGAFGLLAISLYPMFYRVTATSLNETADLFHSNNMKMAVPAIGALAAIVHVIFYCNNSMRAPGALLDLHTAIADLIQQHNFTLVQKAAVYGIIYPAFLAGAIISGRGMKKEVQKTNYPESLEWISFLGLNGMFSAGLTVNGKANLSLFLAISDLMKAKDISLKAAVLEYFCSVKAEGATDLMSHKKMIAALDNALYANKYDSNRNLIKNNSDSEVLLDRNNVTAKLDNAKINSNPKAGSINEETPLISNDESIRFSCAAFFRKILPACCFDSRDDDTDTLAV